MPKYILEADSIIYTIGTKSLLNDIYLKCQTGEIVGLLGSNGSGKSTLLKIIFGSLPSENKHIRINGKVYNRPFAQELIGYLSQDSFLPSDLSLIKIVNIFIPSAEKRSRVVSNQRVKLHLKKRTTQLSGGELRYFELLLLLNLDTPFVLLDEPFSGLEPIFKDQIQELLKEYRKEKGIVITDHDYRQIIEVSDRIILLLNGACKLIKNLNELEDYNYIPLGRI
jgi:ABC-type multidrug transport system ATPase subunit